MLLAFAAGFTQRQAEAIGNATQWPDDPRSGVQPEQGGQAGVEARRRYHFADQAVLYSHWKKFEDLATAGSGDVYSAIGTFLHAEQDSFSHEGFNPVTGQAPALAENLSIFSSWNSAEGEARKYDRTTYDPDKAVRMARDTLGYLRRRLRDSNSPGSTENSRNQSTSASSSPKWTNGLVRILVKRKLPS